MPVGNVHAASPAARFPAPARGTLPSGAPEPPKVAGSPQRCLARGARTRGGGQEPVRCWMLAQEQQRRALVGFSRLSLGCAPPSVSSLILPTIPSRVGPLLGPPVCTSVVQDSVTRRHPPVARAVSSIHHLGPPRTNSANSERQHLSPALKSEFPRQHWGACSVFRSSRTHGNKGFSWMQRNTAPLQR